MTHEWRITHASATGPAHQRAGTAKQDMGHISTFRHRGRIHIATAVADGASSATRSAEGAKIAVDQAVKSLKKRAVRRQPAVAESAVRLAVADARKQLRIEAQTHDTPLSDYATTLLTVLVSPHKIAAAQTGDGGIIMQYRDTPARPVYAVPPHRGEHKGETLFLTSPDPQWQVNAKDADAADIIGIALMTDGLEPAAIQDNQPLPGFFVNLFNWHRNTEGDNIGRRRELNELICSPQVQRVSHDDVTLVVLTRMI